MQNDRRQFYIFDLEVGTKKAGATLPMMDDIVPVFQKMHANSRTYPVRSGDGTMLIGDIRIDAAQQFATLLIRLSDKTTPNSVYSDPLAGQFDEHLKEGDVGSDFGCHVLISTAPEQGRPNIYTCAIERISGLHFGLVQRLLSKLLNYEYNDEPDSFSYLHPAGGLRRDGQPRTERCCPYIDLRGRPSDRLAHDINNGRLSGVTLVRMEAVNPIAGAPYLRAARSELKLDIDHNNMPANVWNSLRGALQLNSADYGTAKVTYRVPNSTKTVTIEIDSTTGSPVAEQYISYFEITNIFPPLAQSAMNVVERLCNVAVPEFVANRNI